MSRSVLFAMLFAGFGCSEYVLSSENNNPPGEETDPDDTPVYNGPQPDIAVEPLGIDFGVHVLGCPSTPQTVTIYNTGEGNLEVTDIGFTGTGGASFFHDGAPPVLRENESYSFEVSFNPATASDYLVALSITSNDPDEPTVNTDVEGEGSKAAVYEERFEQPDATAVDVVWIVDNSGSMSDIVKHLGDSFSAFIDAFSRTGLDYQIGVITTDMDDASQSGQLQGTPSIISSSSTSDPVGAFVSATNLGSSGSGDERGLDAAMAALTDPLLTGTNAGLVRDDAALAVVVISDEDDGSSVGVSDFVSWLDGYKGDPALTTFSAIVGDRGTGCQRFSFPIVTASPSPRYIDSVEATDGVFKSICDLDFKEILEHVAYTSSGLAYSFPLSRTPISIGEMVVEVDGVEVRYNGLEGWTYDTGTNAIEFHGDSVPVAGSVIDVRYVIDEEC